MAYVFPSSVELSEINQALLPRLQAGRVIFDIMPIRDVDSAFTEWDQEDDYTGLQQIRGLDGMPLRIGPIGSKRYRMQPGVYGEFARASETELTEGRRIGSFNEPIDLDNWTMRNNRRLLQRELDRMEMVGWAGLGGTILVSQTLVIGQPSVLMYADSFTVQTYSATVPWSTYATATPLADFSAVQLLARGYSVSLGASAKVYMNRRTFNNLRQNNNPQDLYGRRTQGFGTNNSLSQINELFQGDDLPQIVIYDMGYKTETGAFNADGTPIYSFTPFIADNKFIVIGQRPGGERVAEYQRTRNAQNPNAAPGSYDIVVDGLNERGVVPRALEVHRGHNGGIAIMYPSAIVNGNV